ncbi:OLC1v1036544C1 [Oldenlandia corymbosa var. corymbosa]|uniref:Condensin-1 complex subunit CAP-D2 n=1 Tax=Oldenlandia corymbosa var. corymbosa TaxID=529605 RepID=A0AAV1CVP1_OLDCO|nr:OLC1v1036544C1 [Oldenlandia corymbosa var. corymbosa]
MAPVFVFPRTLHALEEEDEDNSSNYIRLSVFKSISVTGMRPAELDEFVKGVSFDLTDKELFCIEEQDVFDKVYSLVKGFGSLTPACKLNLVEALRSNLSVLLPNVDALVRASRSRTPDVDNDDGEVVDDEMADGTVADKVASLRNAFKIYTFFLVHIVLIEEAHAAAANVTSKMVAASGRKKLPVHSWNWEPQRGRILAVLANSLEINLSLLFGSSDLDENYLSFIVKNAFSMFENATLLKDMDTRDALCRIVGTCATKYHYLAQSCASILHLIHKYDFVVTHLAESVAAAEKKYSDGTLATSLVREIGRTNPKDYVKDTVGAENVGRFLVELADRLPKLVSTNIGLLVPHFGGDSYKIRNALVGVLGKLVAKAFCDVEGEVASKSTRLRTKQAMLEILLERCKDVSAYTRSRVLQVWAELCEQHSVSIGLWNEVAAVAAGRLEDKSAIVRKSALNLLITMLQHNPFGPQLRVSSFEATLEQYKKRLSELEPEAVSKSVLYGLDSESDTKNGDGEVHNEVEELEQKLNNDSMPESYLSQEDDIGQKGNSVPDVGNLEQTRTLVASLEAGLRFSKRVTATMPILVQLMASSSVSDVENSILLLMRCRQFQIDGSEACLRKMLPLVFSQDKSIYEAVESAFITIYLRKNPLETAKNLLNLAIESNIGDLAALEFIIGALVSKGDISTSTLTALWDVFCFNINGTTAEQSRGALSILCMAAKLSSAVLSSHLQDIVDIGFGRWAKVDPLLARTACVALQRLSEEDRKRLLSTNGSRLFGILDSLVTGSWLPEHTWYAAADRAIATMYTIHPTPEILASSLVKKSFNTVFGGYGGDELGNDVVDGSTNVATIVQVTKLSRFLFVVSHVAMNHLVYIDSCVRKVQKGKGNRDKLVAEGQQAHGVDESLEAKKDNNISAELGLAASDDALLDTLSDTAEKEIVSGGASEKNLIGCCAPFISKLCRNFALMQKYPELQASGMLALCRLMIIDSSFCEANLQLLFTVVENAPSETVRSNCTVALGDLAVRFPNLLEPWTENMYARLRDPSASVRKNAVLVLSHLILNDMMKVKGYINEMAICLEDEDERISNLAKLFFHELSKKGTNPVYNLLPDILGKLCSRNLTRESFCNIMQYLIASIKRDKQMESLVEKLCHRFGGVTDAKQWEYMSYCLSQLAFSEKSMKKLMESLKSFEHALSNDTVMDHLRSIINKGKKSAKPEFKSCIEEFEAKICKLHTEKKDQELTAMNAQAHKERVERMGRNVTVENGEEGGESERGEDGEVIDDLPESSQAGSTDGEVIDDLPQSSQPDSTTPDSSPTSDPASDVTASGSDEDEVQSPYSDQSGSKTFIDF